MNLIDTIRSAQDLKKVVVKVQEWGTSITLREMSGLERAKFEADVQAASSGSASQDAITSMSMMIVRCAVDKDGNRALTDEDVSIISSKSMGVIRRLFDAALRINALSKKDIDELEKN